MAETTTDHAFFAHKNTDCPSRDYIGATTETVERCSCPESLALRREIERAHPIPPELLTPEGREEIDSVVRSVRCSAREWASSDAARSHLKTVLAKWLEVYC